jgi:hypothetical protein
LLELRELELPAVERPLELFWAEKLRVEVIDDQWISGKLSDVAAVSWVTPLILSGSPVVRVPLVLDLLVSL